ncbi:FlgM family anti-sigma-28 factor [Tamilnaduibacter salinus]|uniref:Negative regulator of flagellin synthesis n=1 Tax=Tamilnaduibacter salinus TaxID=1484056 RepID=A0A2A2HZK6_9GAMM|nr:flagellar biosynthesis anti-sigma factor FlgM [Tamilnaduibacter salinus]PAV25151.1 flagellar biosynthesis anti-sigma factor FlgM [Tamilnaduibacter salinus]PVY78052.1 FlgM family anti-sigma-28 factor [Tamilnaduibacter salinus]
MTVDFNGVGPGQPNNRTGNATDKTGNAPRTSQQPASDTAAKQSSGARADSVSLSDQSKALKSLESRLAEYPEVDDARVAEIRAALEDGSYKVDAEKLAQKMLDEDQGIFG